MRRTSQEPEERGADRPDERLGGLLHDVYTMAYRIPDSVWVKGPDLRFVYANAAYARALSAAPEDLVGKSDREVFGPERGARYEEEDRRVMAGGRPVVRRGEGGTELLKLPIRGTDGKACALLLVQSSPEVWSPALQAITRWASMVLFSPGILASLTRFGDVMTWSPGAEDLLGYSEEEMYKRDLADLLAPEHRAGFGERIRQAAEGQKVTGYEVTCLTRRGARKHLSVTLAPVFEEASDVWFLCMNAIDVTDRVNAQHELRAALAELAYSHEEIGQFAYMTAGPSSGDAPHATAMEQVAAEVRADPYQDYDYRAAAERLHLSYGYFRQLFRTHIGRSPHAYLLLWRMRRAARELRATDRPVKAIALEAGYVEQAQFSQVFRRVIGVPPSEFRRAMPPL